MTAAGSRRKRTRALLLVGHGSHLNACSSTPVYEHARRLRASGRFDEVVEAFWKEEPSLRDALSLVESDDVYIVPLFLAEGYFTRQVLPRELGLDSRRSVDGRLIHYCPPIGGHPRMVDLVVDRALAISRDGGFDAASATLVIIGHGTERSSTSGDTVYDLVRSLRARGGFSAVTCGFLDEAPGIAEVLDDVETGNVILVPYFLSEGWHTAATIPRDLSLEGTRTTRGGRSLWYAPPVGTLPGIAEIVLSIVADADDDPADGASVTGTTTDASDGERATTRARRRFFEWIDGAGEGGARFLQVRIRREDDGNYRLAHDGDRDVPRHRLVRSTDAESALDIARVDDSGRFRPLRFADSLRRGWALENLDANGLWRAISLLYPGAVLRSAAFAGDEEAPASDFVKWAARQTGMYERIGSIGPTDLDATISECCGSCLRSPRWNPARQVARSDRGGVEQISQLGPRIGRESVPCLEPCTLFGSRAHQRMNESTTATRPAPQPA